MNIVIVGAKDRDSKDDIADVGILLDKLELKYGVFTVLSVMSHCGIGAVVKRLCSAGAGPRKHRFPFVDADVRVYANDLNKTDMSQLYRSRNAMLYEAGDLFFSFPHPQRRAVIDELIEKRVVPNGRPYRVFLPGDDIGIESLGVSVQTP